MINFIQVKAMTGKSKIASATIESVGGWKPHVDATRTNTQEPQAEHVFLQMLVGAPYANRYLGSAFNVESACEKVTDAIGAMCVGNLGGTTDTATIRPKF